MTEDDSGSDLHALEAAAFAAWPALQTQDIGPWHLRWAQGYTKRANSANAARPVDQISDGEIAAIEAWFAARQQPPIFRLASFCTGPAVDDTLAARGYRFADLSLVMARALDGTVPPTELAQCPDAAAWLPVFGAVSGAQGHDQTTHLALLQAIASPCAWGVLRDAQGEAVACGLAVAHGPLLGLFDIATRADQRGRGLGTRLCQGLLAWGRTQGCHTAYLQVMAHNLGALQVYERLGFRRRYHYGYRIRD